MRFCKWRCWNRRLILDETDGLDIDALKIVANGVNQLASPENATILITHYQRLLNYIGLCSCDGRWSHYQQWW